MSSVYSAFSAFRCSVASATDLSSSAMPASKTLISSTKVATASCVFAIANSSSEIVRSSPFFLSPAVSNSVAQYSFFSASSFCSVFKLTTISSIILMTFSKPAALPWIAKAMKSRDGRRCLDARCALRTAINALALRLAADLSTCMKLAAGAGKAFLKRSSASSLFRSWITSERARSSSARVFCRSSHSAFFVSQPFSSSARKA
mmetsp:Transcript_16924/g.37188  ORF Transcript_16924/g.37188 Transcript_16924/m.37188 type:complete len:204 (+) Transcript_16924:716-1327(+)